MASDEPIPARPPVAARAPDPAAEAERQFREEVFPDELAYVRDRRASQGLAAEPAEGAPDAAPSTRHRLVGLALSGGGIRSATFNLGVLQALDRHGLLKHLDYLSTVSGGGFIGSCLTALLRSSGRKSGPPAPFPFAHSHGAEEEETVQYLRGHSDYLAPKGPIDYLRAFALLSRGIALNLVLLVPILLAVSLLGTILSVDDLMGAARRDAWIEALAARMEETPLPDAIELLTRGDGTYRLERDGVLEALAEEPPRALPRGARRPGGELALEEELDWRAAAVRLARLDEDLRSLRVPVLAHHGDARPRALTYRHAEGLRALDPGAARGWPVRLWTDSSPIAAAAFSPDRQHVAAVGYDGSLWVLWPKLETPSRPNARLGIDRRSGRLGRVDAPLERLAFSPDGTRLVSVTADGRVLLSHVVGRLEVEGPVACGGCTVTRGPAPMLTGLGRPVPLALPRSRPAAEVAERRAWNPSKLSLPRTGRTLTWIALLFIGLYPFSQLLAAPLQRIADGVIGGLRAVASRLHARRMRRAAAAPDAAAGRPRSLAIAWRVAGSVLLALPLFGGWSRMFEAKATIVRAVWPFVGFALLGFWWILCVVFLVPVLRRLRPRSAAPAAGQGPPRRATRPIAAALLLLAPWVLLAIDWIPAGLEPLLRPGRGWLTISVWWLGCLYLLAPLLFPGVSAAPATSERALEWHRRTMGRLYLAVHLLPWAYLALIAFHPTPRAGAEYILQPVVDGFGLEGALDLRPGAVAAALAPWALLGYFTGLHVLLWRAFARLARRSPDPAPAAQVAAAEGAGGVERKAATPKPTAAASPLVWRERFEKAFSLALVLLGVVAFFEIQPYLVYHYHALKTSYSAEWLYFLAAASFLAIVLAAMFLQAIRGIGQKLLFLCLGILGPLLPFIVYLTAVDALVYEESWFNLRKLVFSPVNPEVGWAIVSFLIVTVVVAAYLLGKLIDANATGMHGYYRDRLSQSYLVGKDEDGVLGPEKELRLSDVCALGSGAPYHLVNASLNMQRENAGAQRWRNSDFFVFSKRWCGGPQTQYCRTEHLEYLAPGVHLGSAMAVSAAAAAPNMGSYTSGFLVMLMTLLNVRLGLWLPTPRRVRRMARLGLIGSADGLGDRLRRGWLRLKNRPSGYNLINEMASRLDAAGPYVNLSDGGHLENTGAYELLRRRCKLIVIGDAESDPEMWFGSLAALMRYASIDLGIEIQIDLAPLRLAAGGASTGHYAVGRILYPAAAGSSEREEGLLLYLKASVVGGESEVIREYRSRHPDFPQESTADQVFEEDQFEAYRALGFQIGASPFAATGTGTIETEADFEGWLEGLRPPAPEEASPETPR